MGLVLTGSTSGTTTIDATAIAGTGTLTLPTGTDTLVGKATTDTLTNKTVTAPVLSGSITGTYTLAGTPTITSPTITGATISTMNSSVITSGTVVASTSGTSIDFTGIPSWAKRVTLLLSGVSLSGSDNLLVQIGDSGGIETTGYISTSAVTGAGTNYIASTSGFPIWQDASGDTHSGIATICNITANSWVFSHAGKEITTKCSFGGGDKSLSTTLDRIRVTTTGTNTFDAGSINILYE